MFKRTVFLKVELAVAVTLIVFGGTVSAQSTDLGSGDPWDAQDVGLPFGTQQEEVKLTASDAAADDEFGYSVALSGDTAVVGAFFDDFGEHIVAGSAYVFVREGSRWSEQAKLIADDAGTFDRFGESVALSGDTALVGAPYEDPPGAGDGGSAYVFVRNGTSWSQQAKLVASDAADFDRFGEFVALSGDTALVGAYLDDHSTYPDAGSVYVFVRNGTSWSQQAKLTASDASSGDEFGFYVALSGDTALVGAHRADPIEQGAAYVFVRNGTSWSQQAKLTASDGFIQDNFGAAVALLDDTALISAPLQFPDASIYFFERNGTTWSQVLKLTAAVPTGGFGISLALSADRAVVGAFQDNFEGPFTGSAIVFERNGSNWVEGPKLIASDAAQDDVFGWSVALSSGTALIGARLDDNPGGADAGAAYVYEVGPDDVPGVSQWGVLLATLLLLLASSVLLLSRARRET